MKRCEESFIEKQMRAHLHIKLQIGAKFTGVCPQNDKSTRFNILFYYLTLSI